MRFFNFVAACAISMMALSLPSLAETELPALSGDVLLTVSGLDTAKFPDGKVEFDMARLQALGTTEIKTSTIWTEGVHDFTGVSLKAMMDYVGVSAGNLSAKAINDYAVEIPMTDAVDGGPILAYLEDGQPMSVRDKGPIWVMYPFDDKADYRSETVFSRAIWQLDRIEVQP